ncbi:MAG TPA: hypothetical protein DCZ40_08520 [Lachnospiraceae bacterium]|nr:hypothetical protein [Lachnospiraceae bacterium]
MEMKEGIKIVLTAAVNDCRVFFYDYSYKGMIIGAVLACLYCIVCVFRSVCLRKSLGRGMLLKCLKAPFVALLGFYCYLVLGITVLSRKEGAAYAMNLRPFGTWGTDSWHLTLWLENILMLIPLGILLYILWAPFRKIGWSVLAGFLFSLSVECLQLWKRRGKFELDDIMNNVFGMLLGYLLCKGIGRCWGKFRKVLRRGCREMMRGGV